MVTIVKNEAGELIKVDRVEEGCWVNIYPPFNHESLVQLSRDHDVPLDFLTDSIDIDERSRYEKEDDVTLIVFNIPVKNEGITDTDAAYITVPIGIIQKPDYLITISAFENPVIDQFLNFTIKNFKPYDQAKFILQIFDKSVYFYLGYLKQINNLRYSFEKELYNSSRNHELNKLMNIQKSLVYFVTNLRANELVMMKMQRTDFLNIAADEEKIDFFSDIIIDNSQAMEMSDIYSKVLNGTMDAFASIISNNLNNVVKRLTSVTIVLMVPTLVASFYGMNVSLPFEDMPIAFLIIVIISILLSILLFFFFIRKKWF